MILVKLTSDELKNFLHELQFVDVKACEQAKDQLNETVNKSVVKGVVVGSASSFPRICGQLYRLFDHNLAKSEQNLLIFVNAKSAHLIEVLVNFLLLSHVA